MNHQILFTSPHSRPSPSHPPERPQKIRSRQYVHMEIANYNNNHDNNYQQPINMERFLPDAPQKDSQGLFQYREKVMDASDASTNKFKMPKYDFAVKPKPKTLLQKLETSKAGDNDEMCSQSSAVIQAASRRPAPPPSVLHKLSIDVRIMIYDAYFKGSEQNPNRDDNWACKEAPSLVIALRGHPTLYNEMIDRYYRGVNFTLSDYNLREFQDYFPMKFVRVIRHLTVDTQVTVPTQASLHHKYGDYKKNLAFWYPKRPLPKSPVKIRLTSDLPFWLDAQKRNVVDIYPEVWEDFQGLTEHLCSFSSMRKFQQAQNLRSLTIRTDVDDRDVEMLWQFIETLYEQFPRLERLLVQAWTPQNQDIYYLRQLFVTRTPDPEHDDMYYEHKLPNRDPHETQSMVIHEYGTGSIYDPLPLGFRCKLNPKTGEKRDFIFKMDRPWSKGDSLEF